MTRTARDALGAPKRLAAILLAALLSQLFVDFRIASIDVLCADAEVLELFDGKMQTVLLSANASDSDGTIDQVEFFLDGISQGIVFQEPFELEIGPLAVDSYEVTAVATDNSALSTTSAPVNFTVQQAQPTPLVLEIVDPLDGQEITAPATIVGTADSNVLSYYELQYRLKTPADSATWIKFDENTVSVVAGNLGVIDPTMLLNGIYEMRLLAGTLLAQTQASEPITFIIDRKLKIGHFKLSFSDLSVPVSGIPIEIVRTYDSRDQRQGDFGIGWTLDINNVRVQKNRNLGLNWDADTTGGFFANYFLDPRRARKVTVTFSDDQVFKFEARMNPEAQFGAPITAGTVIYQPTDDTHATLWVHRVSP